MEGEENEHFPGLRSVGRRLPAPLFGFLPPTMPADWLSAQKRGGPSHKEFYVPPVLLLLPPLQLLYPSSHDPQTAYRFLRSFSSSRQHSSFWGVWWDARAGAS